MIFTQWNEQENSLQEPLLKMMDKMLILPNLINSCNTEFLIKTKDCYSPINNIINNIIQPHLKQNVKVQISQALFTLWHTQLKPNNW